MSTDRPSRVPRIDERPLAVYDLTTGHGARRRGSIANPLPMPPDPSTMTAAECGLAVWRITDDGHRVRVNPN